MLIAITGGFCTGKSTVAKLFKKYGAAVIDLDELARKAIEPGSAVFKKIVKEFGRDILRKGKIGRLLLAQIVFKDKKKLKLLNSLIHPAVIKEMSVLIKDLKRKHEIVVVDAPLLFEAGLEDEFDYVVVVSVKKNIQLRRASLRKIRKEDALGRINNQWPLKRKVAKADFIIDNNHNLADTCKQVKEVWEVICGKDRKSRNK